MLWVLVCAGALCVDEPRVTNSGLPQGVFMRKQQVPKVVKGARARAAQENRLVEPADFTVGGTIELYGRCGAAALCLLIEGRKGVRGAVVDGSLGLSGLLLQGGWERVFGL